MPGNARNLEIEICEDHWLFVANVLTRKVNSAAITARDRSGVSSRLVRHVVQLDDQKSVVSKRGVYEYKVSGESVCLGARKRIGYRFRQGGERWHRHFRETKMP